MCAPADRSRASGVGKESSVNNDKNANQMDPETNQVRSEEWVPLSVREARRARKKREDLWPYVWINLVSMLLLFTAAVIMAYRVGAQGCH